MMNATGNPRYLVILVILITSCCSKGHRSNFSETVEVVTQQKDFDKVFLQYPYRVRVTGTSLYVTDLHPAEYFCHEFDHPSGAYRRSFARRGKGPQETTDVANIIIDDGAVYLLNAFERKIYSCSGDEIEVLAEFPEELVRCLDFTLYNDSTFVIPDYSGKNRIIFADRKGNILRRVGEIPAKEKEGIPEIALSYAWRPFIHYNPRNGLLAMVTQFGEVLEIYDLKNGRIQVITGPGGEPKCKYRGTAAHLDGIRGYSDVFVGDQYIYALFWGYEYAKVLNGEIMYDGGDLVHVFDLEGKPVRQYHIDRHITGFCVNETTGEVIGTDVNNEQLVMFNL